MRTSSKNWRQSKASCFLLFLLIGAVMLTVNQAGATPIPGVFYGVDASLDSLYIIDDLTAGGSVTVVGALDQDADPTINRFATPVAMSMRPSDGMIFVGNNSSFPGGSTGDLVTVDPLTGEATLVNQTPNDIGFSSLAFAPDGTLYSAGGFMANNYNLYTVNTSTGDLSLVGDLGDFSGMDFGPDGTLYGLTSDKLYTIDPLAASTTLIGTLSMDFFYTGTIAFDPTGTLVGTGLTAESEGVLFDINTLNASVYNLRSIDTIPQGMDFTPIPEPATMLLLGTGLVGLAGFRRKFRK